VRDSGNYCCWWNHDDSQTRSAVKRRARHWCRVSHPCQASSAAWWLLAPAPSPSIWAASAAKTYDRHLCRVEGPTASSGPTVSRQIIAPPLIFDENSGSDSDPSQSFGQPSIHGSCMRFCMGFYTRFWESLLYCGENCCLAIQDCCVACTHAREYNVYRDHCRVREGSATVGGPRHVAARV